MPEIEGIADDPAAPALREDPSESTPKETNRPQLILALLGSNLFALFIGGINEYLSLRGVVSMNLAVVVLVFVWLIGVIAIVASEWLVGSGMRHRATWGSAAAVILALLLSSFHMYVSHIVKTKAQKEPSSETVSGNKIATDATLLQHSPAAPRPSPRQRIAASDSRSDRCPQLGPDPYEFCSDAEVGQWSIDEANKLRQIFRELRDEHIDANSLNFEFYQKAQDCCIKTLIPLHDALVWRLGPQAPASREFSWGTVISASGNPLPWNRINASDLNMYLPDLEHLGMELKRRQVRRLPELHLRFEEGPAPPATMPYPYSVGITVHVPRELDEGYIILIFNQAITEVGPRNYGNTLISPTGTIANEAVNALTTESGYAHYYIVQIGSPPVIPDIPVQFSAYGSRPLHVVEALWLDE